MKHSQMAIAEKEFLNVIGVEDIIISISEILLSDDDLFKPFFEKEPDDNLDIPLEADEDQELNLQSLISIVNHNEILEI
ncbi:19789_t:CDS:2 [Racocetra fulgida]|uniref:19789_t:CDS:1 n=1 Tax=Racocetra fulgida TaxID=60492 RepID=A0A9N8ZMQ9_9GLOM|nr:19789_t:CDS:2 [Racocetra fulgida]